MSKAGIRFDKDEYIMINMDEMKLIKETSEGVEEYEIGGTERKLLWENPDITQEMSGVTMFNESELEGYTHISFIVTDTSNTYEVEELCEIAPLKTHGGQFVVSMPTSEHLYCRKIYRSAGAVKVSISVFDLGKTTGDKAFCIIKSAEAVKMGV